MQKFLTATILLISLCISTELFSQHRGTHKILPILENGYSTSNGTNHIYKDSFDPPPLGAIPGMSSFFDYQTNGANLRNIVIQGNTIIVGWMHTDSLDPTGLFSRRAVYNYSTDGGFSWNDAVDITTGGTRSAYPSLIAVNNSGVVPFISGRVYNPSTKGALWTDAFLGLGSFTQNYSSSGTDFLSAKANGSLIYCSQFNDDTLFLRTYNYMTNSFTNSKKVSAAPFVELTNGRQFIASNSAGDRIFLMWYNPTEIKLYFSESTDGGITFTTPVSLHSDGDIIGGDPTSPWVSGDIIYKPNTDIKCAAWSTYGPGSTITREGMKILFWSPQINGGNPVVVADYNNYQFLGDTNQFNQYVNLQVGVTALSHPSLAFSDDGGKLFCVYSAATTDTLDGFNRNEIYMSHSYDNGATWSTPVEMSSFITDEGFPEYDELYPSISKTGNTHNNFHVVYQATKGPGSQSFSDNAPVYRVWQVYENISFPTSVQDPLATNPEDFLLLQNYPNPFNPETKIVFNLKTEALVTLNIYDISGKLIKSLIEDSKMNAGKNEVIFNGSDLASGIYFYKLSLPGFTLTRKMVLTK